MDRKIILDCSRADRRDRAAAVLRGAVVAAAMLISDPAAAETPAGTSIVNTAALRYDLAGTAQAIASNTVTLIVAERLDVALVRDGQGAIVVSPRPAVVALTLTNRDNGSESFAIAVDVSSAAIMVTAVVVDTDRDGGFDPVEDRILSDSRTPVLSAGQSIALLAVLVTHDDPAAGTGVNAMLTVSARAITGSGQVGTGYSGMGDGGGDAIIGSTGAIARVVVPLTTGRPGPSLFKSQSVRAADGSQNAVRDSVITYTLEARFTDAVTGARIADPIPAGTKFVPGSLTLDGARLSDAADGDAGRFDGGGAEGPAIAVALGPVAAASVHTVQFKARIQ